MKILHWLAHLLGWNGCVAESRVVNGEVWLRHVCATCGKPGCEWWQIPRKGRPR